MKKIPKKEESIAEESPVYLKLRYDESVESKKELLSSELSLLKMMKIIKRYNDLKLEEIEMKAQMYKAIRELDASVKKTKSVFPFLKIPERAKREELVKIETPIKRETFDDDIESQLRNIQEKLKSIGK